MSTEFLSTSLLRNINSILQVYNGKTPGDETLVEKKKKSINLPTVKLQFYLALVVFESFLTGVEIHMKNSVRLCGYDVSMVKFLAYTYS